tara:strand:- start:64 stop:432 length:369 start_codon:yes stop_codon:yes gene_type:complete
MQKTFFKLYADLHNATYKDSDPLKSFLFRTKQHAIIIFFIASQNKKQSTLEQICYNISPKVISRSTVQNILKDGVKINFLEKKLNDEDKRSKYFILSKSGINLLENWASQQSETFENFKRSA